MSDFCRKCGCYPTLGRCWCDGGPSHTHSFSTGWAPSRHGGLRASEDDDSEVAVIAGDWSGKLIELCRDPSPIAAVKLDVPAPSFRASQGLDAPTAIGPDDSAALGNALRFWR